MSLEIRVERLTEDNFNYNSLDNFMLIREESTIDQSPNEGKRWLWADAVKASIGM